MRGPVGCSSKTFVRLWSASLTLAFSLLSYGSAWSNEPTDSSETSTSTISMSTPTMHSYPGTSVGVRGGGILMGMAHGDSGILPYLGLDTTWRLGSWLGAFALLDYILDTTTAGPLSVGNSHTTLVTGARGDWKLNHLQLFSGIGPLLQVVTTSLEDTVSPQRFYLSVHWGIHGEFGFSYLIRERFQVELGAGYRYREGRTDLLGTLEIRYWPVGWD